MTTVWALWDVGEGGKMMYDIFATPEAAMEWFAEQVKDRDDAYGAYQGTVWRPVTKFRDQIRCKGAFKSGGNDYGFFISPYEVKGGTGASQDTV